MGYNKGYSAYQKTNVTTASQGHLVVLLYEGASKNLNNALQCFGENGKIEVCNIEKFSKSIQKAQAIIGELQVSLDMEKGGEIAKNLMALYIFFNNELTDANIKHDKQKIESIKKMTEDLLSSWKVASNSASNSQVKGATSALNIEG